LKQEMTRDRVDAADRLRQRREHRRTEEAGFDCHLTKPADPKALERVLRDVAGEAMK